MRLPFTARIPQRDGVLAAPFLAAERPTSPRKNRVGVFARRSAHRARRNTAQVANSRRVAGGRGYKPVSGRAWFLNQDPIEEQGGINLYAFVGNDGVNGWDYLGMMDASYIMPNGAINVNRPFTPNPLPPRVNTVLTGAWNVTTGITIIVVSVSGEVYSGGTLTPAATAGIIIGISNTGLGFTQALGAISGRNQNAPGNVGDVVAQVTGNAVVGAAVNTVTSIVTLNPNDLTRLPATLTEAISLADNINTSYEQYDSIVDFLASPSSSPTRVSRPAPTATTTQFSVPNVTTRVNPLTASFYSGMYGFGPGSSGVPRSPGPITRNTPGPVITLAPFVVGPRSGSGGAMPSMPTAPEMPMAPEMPAAPTMPANTPAQSNNDASQQPSDYDWRDDAFGPVPGTASRIPVRLPSRDKY
jgi:RHS repeat-associated protein